MASRGEAWRVGSVRTGGLDYAPWLGLTIFLLCTTPAMNYLPGTGYRRLEEFLLLLLLAVVAVRYARGESTQVAWGIWHLAVLGFMGIVFASLLVGAWFGQEAGLVDLFELVRIGKYVVVYTISATLVLTANDPERARRWILYAVTASSVALVPVVVQQYFDLFGLNASYVEAVAKGNQARDLLTDEYATRAIGMVGNPNDMGFLFAMAMLVTVYLMITRRRWLAWGLLVMGLQGTALLMSLSRSALLALALGAVYLVISLPSRAVTATVSQSWVRAGRTLLILLALGITVGLLADSRAVYENLLWRFALLSDFTQDYSWRGRLFQWRENLALFELSPWTGVGPLFGANLRYAGDNEWLTLLRSYGILGTLYLTAALFGPHLAGGSTAASEAERSHRRLVEAVLLASTLYMVTSAVFHSLALMPLVLILLASADSTSRLYTLSKR